MSNNQQIILLASIVDQCVSVNHLITVLRHGWLALFIYHIKFAKRQE